MSTNSNGPRPEPRAEVEQMRERLLALGLAHAAEALSGLARSFLYAGARALRVSHWAVDSEAATRLAISTFDRLKAEPKMGRAEALRQAMLAYLNDASSPRNAYPAFWAPFTLIGEGAAHRISDAALQQAMVRPRSGRWSRNHPGERRKCDAAND